VMLDLMPDRHCLTNTMTGRILVKWSCQTPQEAHAFATTVRAMRKLAGLFLIIQVGLFGVFATFAGPAIAISKSQVTTKVLSLQNMPTRWSVDTSGGTPSHIGGCLKGLEAIEKRAKGIVRAAVAYQDGTFPVLQEIVEAGPGSTARYRKFTGILNGCKTIRFTADGKKVAGTVSAMSLPHVGSSSSAYAISLTAQGQTIGIDLVFFKVGRYDGELLYGDISPDAIIAHAFAVEAIAKILGQPAIPPSMPTTAETPSGPVQ
jgi:hypothetical protein